MKKKQGHDKEEAQIRKKPRTHSSLRDSIEKLLAQRREKAEKPSGKRETKPGNQTRRAKRIGIISLSVISVVVLIIVVLLNVKPRHEGVVIEEEWTSDTQDAVNILICGVDDDAGRDDTLTDVIMVANVDSVNQKATLLQIPRDTYVGDNLVKYGKINGLYAFGYKDGSREAGVACLIETINDQLKLPIDHYVTITMEGFRAAVDALGGVEVTMTKDIDFLNGTKLYEGKTYTLDGEAADWFVRFRKYNDSGKADIERQNTQRMFMAALMKKLLDIPSNQLLDVILAVYPYVKTNMSIGQILQLSSDAKKLTYDQVQTIRLPGEAVAAYGADKVDVFTLHKEETAQMLNRYMRAHEPAVGADALHMIELQKTTTDWYDDEGNSLKDYT